MKRLIHSIALAILCFFLLSQQVFATQLLIPGGQVIGLELRDDSVIVAAFDDACGANAKEAGLCIGDAILSIDKKPIQCIEDVRLALDASQGRVSVTVIRGAEQKNLTLTPVATQDGPRLGVYLRQGIAGIGTITYCEPDTGKFGTLGHGVSNSGGQLLCMREGSAYSTEILSVKKGQCGQPGQLRGTKLEDAPWPATREELIDYAVRSGAPLEVIENLEEIEDEGDVYETIEDIWPDYPQKEDFLWDEEEY